MEEKTTSKILTAVEILKEAEESVQEATRQYKLEHGICDDDTDEEDSDDESSGLLAGGNLLYGFSPEGSFAPIKSSNNFIVPTFFKDSYVKNDDGSIAFQTSSTKDTNNVVNIDYLAEKISQNETLRSYSPTLNKNDIYLNNHMLMLNLRRPDGSNEIFRVDIIGDTVLIQAPFENPCPLRGTDIKYNYIAVPVDSELGIKILSNANYKIKDEDKIDPAVSIFRIDETAV